MLAAFAKAKGFTLIELIATLVIIGILAAVAVVRFNDTADFDRRGFYDETVAALRYAQKAAVAQRRRVCVNFSSTTVALQIASAAGNNANCDTALAGPTGAAPFVVTAKDPARFAAVPGNFSFNGLGQPSAGHTIAFDGLPHTITVEQETGYVRH